MNILVIGGGGREHTIIKKLKQNPAAEKIYALPGNGGIAADAECVDIRATDIDGIVSFVRGTKIDYAVVAPDDPLVLGCVDALEKEGIPCFGPRANAAIIEGSKVFSKNLMKQYGIPTAAYEVFSDPKQALEYLETSPVPTVIKADGLALGKGVTVAMTREEAREAVREIMEDNMGLTVLPSVKARTETSGPSRNSSITTCSPLLPKRPFCIMSVTAARASTRFCAMMTPLPRARPSALMTVGSGAVSR